MRRIKEHKYVMKYLWERWRNYPQWRRVRLGPYPTQEMARMYMVILRWCDAIVADFKTRTIYIIEAKRKPTPWAVDQLKTYMRLFRQTPEFREFWDWQIKGILVAPRVDAETVKRCNEEGIIFELFPED